MRNINISDFSKLKKCFKITLKNSEIIGFNNSCDDITIDGINFSSSGGFDAVNENFYSDLTSGNSNIVGFIDNNKITINEVLSGKFDNATVEIFFVNPDNTNEKVNITKGQIKSIKLIDGKIMIDIGSILDILDKNIGEIFSPMCRAKFWNSTTNKNILNSKRNLCLLLSVMTGLK